MPQRTPMNPEIGTNKHELILTLRKRTLTAYGSLTCPCAPAKSKASRLFRKYSWLRFKTAFLWVPSRQPSKHKSWLIRVWPTSWTWPANLTRSAQNTLNTWTSRSRTTSRRIQRSTLESPTVSSENACKKVEKCLCSQSKARADALLLSSHTW